MTKIVFVDVETTGLDPDRHAIWEVALITPDGAEHVWQFPVDEVAADPGALKISGWYERRWEVAGADQGYVCIGSSDVHLYRTEGDRRAVPPSIQGAWAECFRDLVGTAHMCGAVVSFDEERLRRLLLRHGIRPRWHYHLIDEPLLGPLPSLDLTGIDWVIVGGESGPGARPMHPDWVRDIRDRCVAAGIPFFFKQWGAWSPTLPAAPDWTGGAQYVDTEGKRSAAPTPGAAFMQRLGKKAAGRLLDGRTWDEMPAVHRGA